MKHLGQDALIGKCQINISNYIMLGRVNRQKTKGSHSQKMIFSNLHGNGSLNSNLGC